MPTCHAISGSRFNPLVTRRYPVLRLAVIVLVAIWALAVFTKHTMGGFAHAFQIGDPKKDRRLALPPWNIFELVIRQRSLASTKPSTTKITYHPTT